MTLSGYFHLFLLPQVSYIKAIDVWVVSSLIFVFAALLEFAYVNVLARRADKEVAVPMDSSEDTFEVRGTRQPEREFSRLIQVRTYVSHIGV